MSEFRVTFGARYRDEPHPCFAAAHPDGWVTIVADGEAAARAVAIEHLGHDWASLYTAARFDELCRELGELAGLYPRGELARFTAARAEPVDLDRLAALDAAATPPPWTTPAVATNADADLVLAARNALPALLAELRELRQLLAAGAS